MIFTTRMLILKINNFFQNANYWSALGLIKSVALGKRSTSFDLRCLEMASESLA